MNSFANNIIKRAVVALSILFAVIALISILRVGFAFWLYSYFAKWVTVRLGLDYYLAELLAVAFTSAVLLMVPGVGGIILSRKRRLMGAVTIVGAYLLMCVLVYTVGKNVYFNRVTGDSLRYYADTPEGREFSFTPGFHPRYGIEYKPYTREVINQEIEQRKKLEESLRRKQIEQQRLEEANRKRQEIELQKRDEQQRRQEELNQRRLEAEARRQQEIELQKLEAERRDQELEQQRLEVESHRQQLEQQQQEAEERTRQQEIEHQRSDEENRQRRELEQQRRDEIARSREQESQRKREERNQQIMRGISGIIERFRKRN